jgi:iduronate 2-sulfatase
VPGNKANGTTCLKPVELVSLHKTLTDVCGIAADKKTEGHSLRPLVENPEVEWKHAAYSQVTRNTAVGTFEKGKKGKSKAKPIMGRSVRTERWRYTEWDEGRAGIELYDHDHDAAEMKNLAKDPKHADAMMQMRQMLKHP